MRGPSIGQPAIFFALTVLLSVLVALPDRALSQDVKRGLGSKNTSLADAVNSRWAYDWGYQGHSGYNGEYVPMFWGRQNVESKIDTIKGYGNVNYVLGFNEPERADQANMTVDLAIDRWATISSGFSGTGIKLVSPAVSDNQDGRDWLDDFMTRVDADSNLIVDEVAFHWYGTVNINNPTGTANGFLSRVDDYYNKYGRNIWVTEFAGLDFGNQYTTQQMNDWNATFLQTAVAGLESRSYVTRYAWWNHNDDSRLVSEDSYGVLRPTKVGDRYYQTLLSGNSRNMNGVGLGTDNQYLRGGSLVNDGAALGDNAVPLIYAMSNHDGSLVASSLGGTGDWGMQAGGSVSIEANSTLRKIGTNTISWRNQDIYNDGLIRLMGGTGNEGTLWIHGQGTNAVGEGQIRLDSGSHLKLGKSGDTHGFSLGYPIQYRGGRITVDGAGVVLAGDSTIYNQTFFQVNGDLTINGSFLGNAAGIVKNGDGKMALDGNNQYAGYTTINAGTLAVNGSIGGNHVLINAGGTLSGVGQIASNIVARDGSTVTPGNSAGTLTAAGASFAAGSELVLELATPTEFDRLVLSGGLTVDQGATLRIELLNGFVPEFGSEFDVLDFASFSGGFGVVLTPGIQGGVWDFGEFQTNGRILFSAVPEPGAVLWLISFLIILVARRKRKRFAASSGSFQR